MACIMSGRYCFSFFVNNMSGCHSVPPCTVQRRTACSTPRSPCSAAGLHNAGTDGGLHVAR
jgi:hypothetical protein